MIYYFTCISLCLQTVKIDGRQCLPILGVSYTCETKREGRTDERTMGRTDGQGDGGTEGRREGGMEGGIV